MEGFIFGFVDNAVLIFGALTGLEIEKYFKGTGVRGAVFGAAIGNLIDRILYREVVDFLDFLIGDYHWYIFNLADAAVSVGMAILLSTPCILHQNNLILHHLPKKPSTESPEKERQTGLLSINRNSRVFTYKNSVHDSGWFCTSRWCKPTVEL